MIKRKVEKIFGQKFAIVLLLISVNCNQDDTPITPPITCLLWPNSYYGFPGSEINFSIVCPLTERAIDDAAFFINGTRLADNRFVPNINGKYYCYAEGENFKTDEIEISIRDKIEFTDVEIPLLLHIINDDLIIEAKDLIEALNDIFQGITEHDPLIADTRIRFRPATYDLEGNELQNAGVVRHNTNDSDSILQKSIMREYPPEKYLNVVLKPFEHLGLAFPPPANTGFPECTSEIFTHIEVDDSISSYEEYASAVKHYSNASKYLISFVGLYVTPPSSKNEVSFVAETLAHEIGHFFGLPHQQVECEDIESDCLEDASYGSIDGITKYCANDQLVFSPRSIMDSGGLHEGFTFDQSQLMHFVLQHRPMVRALQFSSK